MNFERCGQRFLMKFTQTDSERYGLFLYADKNVEIPSVKSVMICG